MTWPLWHEPVILGRGELVGVGIAHAIVLGIALWRYVLWPRIRPARSPDGS